MSADKKIVDSGFFGRSRLLLRMFAKMVRAMFGKKK